MLGTECLCPPNLHVTAPAPCDGVRRGTFGRALSLDEVMRQDLYFYRNNVLVSKGRGSGPLLACEDTASRRWPLPARTRVPHRHGSPMRQPSGGGGTSHRQPEAVCAHGQVICQHPGPQPGFCLTENRTGSLRDAGHPIGTPADLVWLLDNGVLLSSAIHAEGCHRVDMGPQGANYEASLPSGTLNSATGKSQKYFMEAAKILKH